MSNSIWKRFEAEIAGWLGTKRNPLSGANNYTDAGKHRRGDVVTALNWSSLIECKTRKKYSASGIYTRAQETLKEAEAFKYKNWFHFERKTGSKKIYILATDRAWMEKICRFLASEMSRDDLSEDEKQ